LQRGTTNNKLAGCGLRDPFKTAAIEGALDRATIRLGIYTLIANI